MGSKRNWGLATALSYGIQSGCLLTNGLWHVPMPPQLPRLHNRWERRRQEAQKTICHLNKSFEYNLNKKQNNSNNNKRRRDSRAKLSSGQMQKANCEKPKVSGSRGEEGQLKGRGGRQGGEGVGGGVGQLVAE